MKVQACRGVGSGWPCMVNGQEGRGARAGGGWWLNGGMLINRRERQGRGREGRVEQGRAKRERERAKRAKRAKGKRR